MASRWKKEEAKKRAKAREGLAPDEIAALDAEETAKEAFDSLVREFHTKLFPEEYDFMFDSRSDISCRSTGGNPRSKAYQDKVNRRRIEMGFNSLASSGMAQGDDTSSFVYSTLENQGSEPLLDLISKYDLSTKEPAYKPEILSAGEINKVLSRLKNKMPGERNLNRCAENLVGFFLEEDWVHFEMYVTEELVRRFPKISNEAAKKACEKALDLWVEAYCG
ncbi:MAG: hypothetical protein HN400_17175 [Nitrospinaceae bacterium]|nr:hypothetical protein [Nitrospinaceae bacterium]